MIRVKFDAVVQMKLNIVILFLSEIYETRNCVTDWVRNFNNGMHSNICETIWFKLSWMIDSINIKLYI